MCVWWGLIAKTKIQRLTEVSATKCTLPGRVVIMQIRRIHHLILTLWAGLWPITCRFSCTVTVWTFPDMWESFCAVFIYRYMQVCKRRTDFCKPNVWCPVWPSAITSLFCSSCNLQLDGTVDLDERRRIRSAIRELRRREIEDMEAALASKRFRPTRLNQQEDKENQHRWEMSPDDQVHQTYSLYNKYLHFQISHKLTRVTLK